MLKNCIFYVLNCFFLFLRRRLHSAWLIGHNEREKIFERREEKEACQSG